MTRLFLVAILLSLAAAGQPMGGTLAGTVTDPSGARVPDAMITATDLAGHRATAYSDDEGAWSFAGLPAGEYVLEVRRSGFAPYHQQNVQVTASGDIRLDMPLQIEWVNQVLDVVAPRPGPPASTPARRAQRTRVGGNVQPPRLIKSVRPVYPEASRQLGLQGTVILDGVIGTDGSILSIQPGAQNTAQELLTAALDAVRQWRYTPTLLNGVPVEVQMEIAINFRLQ